MGPKLRRSAADTTGSVEAFELVQRIRIQRQLAGGEYDEINRINPSELSPTQRMMIKEAFKQAGVLQLRLRQEFAQQ